MRSDRIDPRRPRRRPTITAFLFHDGGHDDPARLAANASKSFLGSHRPRHGLHLRRHDNARGDAPSRRCERLIAKDPRNAERIFPYIGGEEVNDSPTHAHRRYVINFGEMTEAEARGWPDLMAIVEAKVKPERLRRQDDARRRRALVAVRATAAGALRARSAASTACSCYPRVSQHLRVRFLPRARSYSPSSSSSSPSTSMLRSAPSSLARTRSGRGSSAHPEGRSALHAVRLLRDFPVPGRLGDQRRARSRRHATTTSSAPRSWSATTRA